MLLNAQQVGEKLGINPATVRQMCDDGRLPAVDVMKRKGSGRHTWRIDDKALTEWLRTERTKPPVPAPAADGYITLEAASQLVGQKKDAIAYLCRTHKLISRMAGRLRMVQRDDVVRHYGPTPAAAPSTDGPGALELLRKMNGVLPQIDARLATLEQKLDELIAAWR